MPQIYSPTEMLAKLVAFPTVSRDSNIPLMDFVADYLAGHGIESHRVPSACGTKHNLYASVGPAVEGGVVLSGHTDVVPIDGQDWTTDPWVLTEKAGKLYGRGSCDMKSFLALALCAVPKAQAAGLKRPLQLAFTYDEEVGMDGAFRLAPEIAAKLPKASAMIVGEPSSMQVVNGHKGGLMLETHVRGHEVHSSLIHTGVPAVMVAARLICWLEDRMEENQAAADAASLYVPPWTTCHVGVIQGGTATNITAKECSFSVDIRPVPPETNVQWLERYQAECTRLETEIKAIHPDAAITIEMVGDTPGCRPEMATEAEALCRQLTGDNAEHVVSYGTEAGIFQDHGYSACICGPGSIDQAHQPDEFIEISQLAAGEAFMDRLIERPAS